MGERVRFARPSSAALASSEAGTYLYTDSGTSALALIMAAIVRQAETLGRNGRQVAIPAYGCPDIVSAIESAGLQAKLVDLAEDSPFPSRESWLRAIDDETLAVVTAGFLGLRDPFAPADAAGIGLPGWAFTEDCCQIHPMAVRQVVDRNVALSFGRGKPVSILHGGAAKFRKDSSLACPVSLDGGGWWEYVRLTITAQVYNLARSPLAYRWVSSLLAYRIGVTRYSPLKAIIGINRHAAGRLDTQAGWFDEVRWGRQEKLGALIKSMHLPVVKVDLATSVGAGGRSWLLRYPLLLRSRQARDSALAALSREGLGASAMYLKPLNEFDGVRSLVTGGTYPNAQSFAERLLTLPLHADVSDRDIEAICRVLGNTR